ASKNTNYNYNFISDDGLCIANFACIRSIISVLKLIIQPSNILYYTEVLLALNGNNEVLENNIQIDYKEFPKPLLDIINHGFSFPLYVLCDNIIHALNLNYDEKNFLILENFQNIILNFEINNCNNIYDFLEYWEKEGKTKKIQANTS